MITSTSLSNLEISSYFLYTDRMAVTIYIAVVRSLTTHCQSCTLWYLTDPRSSYIVSISDYVLALDRAVVGIAGVVSVLSGSFLGSVPSMNMACETCQPNVKFCRLSSKGPISFARRIKDAQLSCFLWIADVPTQSCKTLTIFARCHDTVFLKLKPAQRMIVYLFRLQSQH